MPLAPPQMVLRRVVVAAPYMASAFLLADRHGWPTVLFWSAFGWTALVQFATNGLVRSNRRRALVVMGAVAVAIGPAAWVWGGTYTIWDSVLASSCLAVVAGVVFIIGWSWASRPPLKKVSNARARPVPGKSRARDPARSHRSG